MKLPKITHQLVQIDIPSTKGKALIRPMLVKEEKILLAAKQSEDFADIFMAIKQIVNNCLSGVEINDLALFDLEYIYLKIRAISSNNIQKVSYQDTEDQKIYDFEIDLNKDVTVRYPENSSAINFEIGTDKFTIFLKYPPASLYDDKGFLKLDSVKFLETLVYRCLDKIVVNDEITEFTADEFYAWLDELPVQVYEKIQKYFSNLPSMYHEIKYTNSLGHERSQVLKSIHDFFSLR